jgi:non-specific serine/threonine protein kinase/serine/threonine-protein kinase
MNRAVRSQSAETGASLLAFVEGLPDRFQILRGIGQTPHSLLFLATEKASGDSVTLSVLRPEMSAAVSRNELSVAMEAARTLDHPCIEAVLEAGRSGDLDYHVAGHGGGWTARDKLDTHGPPSPAVALQILLGIAEGLAYAHERGVPHLLLSPEMVVLTGETVQIRGFGTGQALVGASGGLELPADLVTSCVAPELRRGPVTAPLAADLYSLGALGQELLVGQAPGLTPWTEESLGQALAKRLRAVSAVPPADSQETASELARFLASCLDEDPGRRPPDAAAAEAALRVFSERFPPDDEGVGGDVRAGPERIGPFRILEKLGEGGMGAVYLAERLDGLSRPVALKVIRLGMDSREVVRRFEREGEALGLLDHENVARIYDASISEGGRPYFVMEVVEGLPITDCADARRMDLPSRLALFESVCRGVQHAHQKGVIHRDLKPSNVLVSATEAAPRPKVIDFGLAKVMSDPAEGAPSATRAGQAVGTPEYMSPEQAAGSTADVDTRSDVYSLGVVLYEVLTGLIPTVSDGQDPAPPSTVVTHHPLANETARRRGLDPSGLAVALRGELDAIVLRCLEHDRANRYQTAKELVDDLVRYREDAPVLARPQTGAYRAWKFVRRHRVGVSLAGAAVLLLVAGLATMTLLWTLASAAEAREAAESDAADQVVTFMTEVFRSADPFSVPGEALARDLLDQAAERMDTAFSGQPNVRRKVLQSMGVAYSGLGLHSRAESIFREVIELHEEVDRSEVSDFELTLATFFLARAVDDQGRRPEADSLYQATLDGFPATADADSSYYGRALMELAFIRSIRGNLPAADSLMDLALTHLTTSFGPDHELVAEALVRRASYLGGFGRVQEAVEPARQALDILRRNPPSNVLYLQNVYLVLARIAYTLESWAEAEEYAREAAALVEGEVPEDHASYRFARTTLANAVANQGRHEEALGVYEELLAVGRSSPRRPNLTSVLHSLGTTYLALGRLDEARDALQEALDGETARSGEVSMIATIIDLKLGRIDLQQGRAQGAARRFEGALEFRIANYESQDQAIADVQLLLSQAYLQMGRLGEAEAMARAALEAYRLHLPESDPTVARAATQLAEVLRALGRNEGGHAPG